MANFTGEGNFTSKLNKVLSAPPAGIDEFFSVLNIFLSITAAVGNAVVFIALKNVSSIHPPTKLFFRSLAITDLCVGLYVQPLFATHIIFRITNMKGAVSYYVNIVNAVSSNIFCRLSVLTSTAISVDRLLALLLGLRYRHVVTSRRACVVITCLWLFAALSGWLSLWRINISYAEASVVLILSLITSIFCYTRIHLKLRHQQVQVQNNAPHGQQNGEETPLNIARYKKTVSSIMWLQLALVACYVPWGVVAVLYANGIKQNVAWTVTVTATFVYSNSSLNPILYCWKIRDVKQAVKGTIRQLYCL